MNNNRYKKTPYAQYKGIETLQEWKAELDKWEIPQKSTYSPLGFIPIIGNLLLFSK
jgi:hypothetical protein